jgi:hypothetical protein
MKLPDASYLIKKSAISYPVIGLYDTPHPDKFEPLVSPSKGRWACLFMFFSGWLKGKSLHITPDNFGCGGMGTYLFDVRTRSRDNYIDFLHGKEGLKATADLMGQWIDENNHYQAENPHLIIGPLKEDYYEQLRTVTFFINPDQLSLFVTGAHYYQESDNITVVSSPFASGCGQMLPSFRDQNKPEAIIGATDIAMRKYLPSDILTFTVTKPMFEQLCRLDENSFLNKPFWAEVQKAREKDG